MSKTKGAYSEQHYGATLQDIADHFGKTKEWARQEISKALNKLRQSGNLDSFKDLVNR